ncbi:MAG: hypothetical protein ABR985_07650 [Methanotrichaceae archaeon]
MVKRPEGLTRDEISQILKVSPQRVSRILSGEKGVGGLAQKVQIAETRISDMTRINDDEKRTVHKTLYSLKDYDSFVGFEAVVKLSPSETDETSTK